MNQTEAGAAVRAEVLSRTNGTVSHVTGGTGAVGNSTETFTADSTEVLTTALQTVSHITEHTRLFEGRHAWVAVDADSGVGVDGEPTGSTVLDVAGLGRHAFSVGEVIEGVGASSTVSRVVFVTRGTVDVTADDANAVWTDSIGGVDAGSTSVIARTSDTVRILTGETLSFEQSDVHRSGVGLTLTAVVRLHTRSTKGRITRKRTSAVLVDHISLNTGAADVGSRAVAAVGHITEHT